MVPPPLFSGISAGDYTEISAAARTKEFDRGEVLYIEGDPVEQVVLVSLGGRSKPANEGRLKTGQRS